MGGGRRAARDRRRRSRPRALTLLDDLALAERAARAAGELLLERFGGPARGLERKSSRTDMVSDADRDAEAAIEEILLGERPNDALVAEEGAHREGGSGRRWVVDPLDGTTNFLYGLPAWAVSIALEDEVGGAAGVVHDPVRGETFTAARGLGARLNGEPIRVSEPEKLGSALVATGFGYDAERRRTQAELLVAVLPTSATSAARGRRPSTSAGWPRAGSTATTSAGSSRGTGPPAASS